MDHFCPFYFALLGLLDQEKLAEQIIPEHWAEILNKLSAAGVRFMVGGDLALAPQGVPGRHAGPEFVLDPAEDQGAGSEFHVVLPVQPRHLESAGSEALIAAVRAATDQVSRTI